MCSLHPCPLWGRQEMPASSQESLLRWDFPIYFIEARRPDTGGDKHSRLLALIITGSWAPHSLSAQDAGQNLLWFQIEKTAQLKKKMWSSPSPVSPCKETKPNNLLNGRPGWYSDRGIPKAMKRLAFHVAAQCSQLGVCEKVGVPAPLAGSWRYVAHLPLVQLTGEMFGGHTAAWFWYFAACVP